MTVYGISKFTLSRTIRKHGLEPVMLDGKSKALRWVDVVNIFEKTTTKPS